MQDKFIDWAWLDVSSISYWCSFGFDCGLLGKPGSKDVMGSVHEFHYWGFTCFIHLLIANSAGVKMDSSDLPDHFLFWIIWWMRDRFRNTISIPYDHLISGMINIVDGFPAMFLIIVLVVLLPFKGWLVIMLIIGLLHWPVMSRYVRAEVYKMRESNYIKAVQVINLPSYLILKKHILPFALRPVMVSFIFGVASAILAESTLSFLGIGLPLEQMNWGRLLAQSRSHFDAWWLMLFPGGAIFLTLISLYTIGNAWQRKINA